MSNSLLQLLNFDINSSLQTSGGIIPIFNRNSPAYYESVVNGSIKWVATAFDQPRFSSGGSLYLEKESLNLVTHSTDFTHNSWVKGSSWTVLRDRVPSPAGPYTAERISVSQTLGNNDAQTMYKDILAGSGQQYTATAYIRLAGGRFGPNDRMEVGGDVATVQSVTLGSALNDLTGNYVAISVTFTSAGSPPSIYTTDDIERTVRLSFFVEQSVSFDLAAVQVEPGAIRTSFIESEAEGTKAAARDGDTLQYPSSPIEGLQSFLFYMNLELWREDGLLVEVGNFKVEIANGQLQASCSATTATDPDPLPQSAKIAVRVSRGQERLQIYVNRVLKISVALTGYTANAGRLNVCGDGVRQFKCLYFFNRAIDDGGVAVGQSALSDLLRLHAQDSLFPELAEGYGQISFPSVRIAPGQRAAIKMPNFRSASQTMTNVTPGAGLLQQAEIITVETIVNPAAAQRDSITINNTQFELLSDANPTPQEIAAGFAAILNTTPRYEPVQATHNSGDDFLVVASQTPGIPFYLSVSANLSARNTVPNRTSTYTVTVAAAVDYEVGAAIVYRGYTWIADVSIESINTLNNTIQIVARDDSILALIRAGDTLVQPSWQYRLGRNSYMVHHLEDHPDIRIVSKTDEDFALRNIGVTDRIVTPYIKIWL